MWEVVEKPIPSYASRFQDAKVEYGGWVGYPPAGFSGEVVDGYSFYELVPEHDPNTGCLKSYYLRFVKSQPLDASTFYVKLKSGFDYWSTRNLVAVAVWFVWKDKKSKNYKKSLENEKPQTVSYYEKRFIEIQ